MDVVADMVNGLKNAARSGKNIVTVDFSKYKHDIAMCLKREGYVATVEKKTRHGHPYLELTMDESTGKTISEVKRISKPSRRMYGGVNDFRGYVSGRGILVISTPKGILTHREAKKEMVGGELLFTMW